MTLRPFIDSAAKVGRPRETAQYKLVKRKKEKVTFEVVNKEYFRIIVEDDTKAKEIKVSKNNVRLLTNWLLEVCFEPRWNKG